MRREIAIVIVLSMLFMIGTFILLQDTNAINKKMRIQITDLKYIQHGIIRINNNTEFARIAQQEGWPGDGSENNPYIIEGYDIDARGAGNCIYIGNTTVYFIIKNCYLHNSSYLSDLYFEGVGILLYNVQNGIIDNNTFSNNEMESILLYLSLIHI